MPNLSTSYLGEADTGTLAEHHKMITAVRDTGNGIYLSSRAYPTGDVEMVGIQLNSEDSLKRGGGGKRKNKSTEDMDYATKQKSIARARTMVRRKCLSITANRLLTLTFRENITDVDEAWSCLHYFVKQMRTRYGDEFKYVCVPEYQQRGAVHFHLAVNGYYDFNTVRGYWKAAVGKRDGNIDFTTIKTKGGKDVKSPKKIAGYIAKYISKAHTDNESFNRKKYSSGGKIQIPSPIIGWMALGLPVIQVMRQAIESMTHLAADNWWESENRFSITYVTT